MIPLAASAAISAAGSVAGLLASSTADDPKPAKAGDSVSQADFMQLLIAQLQNQDPLNPLDSANFSAQLAQFSSLQQLTEINQHLKESDGAAGTPSRFDAVGFLGKDVRGVSDIVTVEDGAATALGYTLASAGTVQAKITDAGGREVASLVLGAQSAGAHELDLAGVEGAPQLADGTYTVRLIVADAEGNAVTVPTLGGGLVTGVDLAGESPVLLIGERRLALTDVREVKQHATSGA
jgi:flagellar basal-body rod modification protein FlgD